MEATAGIRSVLGTQMPANGPFVIGSIQISVHPSH